jgi:hypothetical protein
MILRDLREGNLSMTTYVTGRDIGQTERAMQQLLESVIAGTPLASTEHWVALTVIANAPVAPDTPGLSRALRSSLSATASVADHLTAVGLVNDRDGWVPTAAGRVLFGEIFGRVQELTAQLAEGLDAADIETTRRVLATLTERASILAAAS